MKKSFSEKYVEPVYWDGQLHVYPAKLVAMEHVAPFKHGLLLQ